MAKKRFEEAANSKLPPLPMSQAVWKQVSESLALSPQQTRIVELILRGQQDKEIAATLNITVATLRSHLDRINCRLQSNGRTGIILLVFQMALEMKTCSACGQ